MAMLVFVSVLLSFCPRRLMYKFAAVGSCQETEQCHDAGHDRDTIGALRERKGCGEVASSRAATVSECNVLYLLS